MGNIQMIGKSPAEKFRGEKPLETKLAPEWALTDVADHAIDFWLSTEDLPKAENRVTLNSDGNVQLAVTSRAIPRAPSASTTSSSRCWATCACTRTTSSTGSHT